MSHVIQRISDFKLTIDNTEYYTTDLKLVLLPSAIPSFTATIASHTDPGIYDIDTAYETFKKLNNLIYSNKVNLAVTIESLNSSETEELNLKDWVLVSVDETIGTNGTLTITASHPAIYLALMGGFMNVTSTVTSHFTTASIAGAKDIVDIYQRVLDRIKKAPVEKNNNSRDVTASDGRNIESINREIKEAVSRHLGEHKISSLLKWDPGVIEGGSKYRAFPNVRGMSNDAEKAIKRALFDYPLSINNVDVFSNFINICCASLGISILPYYWEPALPVAPLSYWAESSIDIDVSNTFSLDLNIYDYAPIFGTRILAQGTTAATMSAYYNTSKEKSKETSYQIAYVPKHSKADLAGKFVTFSSPNWFDSMLTYFSSASGISGFDIKNSKNSKSVSSAKNKNLPGTERLLLRVAEQIFYTLYRARTQVRFSTHFMTNSKNKRIVPGQVITLKDNDKTVVTGYCNQVIIVLSPNEKAAYTSVSLSHIRTPDGNYLIKDGTLNPLYI